MTDHRSDGAAEQGHGVEQGLDSETARSLLRAAGIGPAYLRGKVRELPTALQAEAWGFLQVQLGNTFVAQVRGDDPGAAQPQEAAPAAAPQHEASDQRAALKDLMELADMNKEFETHKRSLRSSADVHLFMAKCQRVIGTWRARYPATGEGPIQKSLSQMERIRDNVMRKHHELRAAGDYHHD